MFQRPDEQENCRSICQNNIKFLTLPNDGNQEKVVRNRTIILRFRTNGVAETKG